MKRVLLAGLFASALSVAWSTALASSHSESPVRRGGQGCGSAPAASAPATVVRPGTVSAPRR